MRCTQLQDPIFPEKLYKIKAKAFQDCNSIRKLVFPAELKLIDWDAFCFCLGLENLCFESKIPPKFGETPFLHIASINLIKH